jgi:hypothetical protein
MIAPKESLTVKFTTALEKSSDFATEEIGAERSACGSPVDIDRL